MKNVRVIFSKTGRAKFISHLDLARTMARVVRRAGIPLWYTEGFNRHPYLTFAAPLSLGYEGLREIMDLKLEEDMPADELVRRMNEAMPEGLSAVSAAEAVHKAGDLAAADYRLTLSCPPERVRALLAQPEILVEKRTKKKTLKTLDIRPAFAGAEVTAAEGGCTVSVRLPCSSNETVNPGLLLQALNHGTGESCRYAVLRTELLLADGTPFC